MSWDYFKFTRRPRLQDMNTGVLYPERPYGPPPTSIYGDGGQPIIRNLDKLQPAGFSLYQGVVPVSIGGNTDQIHNGIELAELTPTSSASF